MAYNYIANSHNTTSAVASTLSCLTSINVATGDLICAYASWETTSAQCSIADTLGGNSMQMLALSNQVANIYGKFGYKISATSNSTSIFKLTLTASPDYITLAILQYRPTATVTFDTGPSGAVGTNANPPISGNITPTTSTDILVVGATGFTNFSSVTNSQIGDASATAAFAFPTASDPVFWTGMWYTTYVSSPGAVHAQAVLGKITGQQWVCDVMSFIITGGGSTSTIPIYKKFYDYRRVP